MTQTVIGVFERYEDAQQAERALQTAGFDADDIHLSNQSATSSTSTMSQSGTAIHEEGFMARVREFFSDLFHDDDQDATHYAEAFRRGLLAVKVDVDRTEQASLAQDVLRRAGAVDIDEQVENWRASGWTGDDLVGSRQSANTDAVIPVVKEELEVGKRVVNTGGVRVYARTVETPVEESVQLRSEHAEVERRPVNRPATAADLDALQDRTIEVRETAEKAVVAKNARVIEEVSVGKTAEQRTERVADTLRKTEVEVERLGSRESDDVGLDTPIRR